MNCRDTALPSPDFGNIIIPMNCRDTALPSPDFGNIIIPMNCRDTALPSPDFGNINNSDATGVGFRYSTQPTYLGFHYIEKRTQKKEKSYFLISQFLFVR
jgi:hypothetical protein